MRAPIAPEQIQQKDLLDLVAHLNQAHRISERLFRQHDPMVVRVPSNKYLVQIGKLLNTSVKRLETWGNHQFLSVTYDNVEFNTYEPKSDPWDDDRK